MTTATVPRLSSADDYYEARRASDTVNPISVFDTTRPAPAAQEVWAAIDRHSQQMARAGGWSSWQLRRDEKLRLQAIGDRVTDDALRRGQAVTSPETIRAAINEALRQEFRASAQAVVPPRYMQLAGDAAQACFANLELRLAALRRRAAEGDLTADELMTRLEADLRQRAAAEEQRQDAIYRTLYPEAAALNDAAAQRALVAEADTAHTLAEEGQPA